MKGAYYNEHAAYPAAWLRNLIAEGLIPDGEVDERSIVDVRADDIRGFTQAHFFAGIGGWPLAARLSGWRDDRPIWTGSCPCQPFSIGGGRAGFADERHLWPEFRRLIAECGPSVVFGEQVASPDGLAWLDVVCTDMEAENCAIGAVDCCAAGVGAPHIRQRIWIVAERLADANDEGLEGRSGAERGELWPGGQATARRSSDPWHGIDVECRDGRRPIEPSTFPLAHGASARVGRLRAYGNAIVPQVAAEVIKSYMECRP